MIHLAIAAIAVVGTQFLLSRPWRRPLVQRVCDSGFLLVCSVVAFATLGWLVVAYRAAPWQPLWWEQTDLIWAIGIAIAIIFLALVGAHLQDRKKAVLEPCFWPEWQKRTSYWPFAAIAQGRAKFGGFKAHALAGGVVLWLAATWAPIRLANWPAGIWRRVG